MKKWLHLLEQIGPIVLAVSPLAPIAPYVIAGIQIAEQLGLPGAQKKQLVQQLATVGAQAVNAVKPGTVSDTAVSSETGAIIDAVVGATNLVHKATPTAVVIAP